MTRTRETKESIFKPPNESGIGGDEIITVGRDWDFFCVVAAIVLPKVDFDGL